MLIRRRNGILWVQIWGKSMVPIHTLHQPELCHSQIFTIIMSYVCVVFICGSNQLNSRHFIDRLRHQRSIVLNPINPESCYKILDEQTEWRLATRNTPFSARADHDILHPFLFRNEHKYTHTCSARWSPSLQPASLIGQTETMAQQFVVANRLSTSHPHIFCSSPAVTHSLLTRRWLRVGLVGVVAQFKSDNRLTARVWEREI